MLSVRVYVTDFASDVVARFAWELGAASPLEAFGRVCLFLSHVADKAPDGVLDGLGAGKLASWAAWTGAADVFLEAALRSGFLCRPSVDPHHHKGCTARAPGRKGEPARQHPPAELAVHQWDRRMGRIYREFLRKSRVGRVSILLRPPPRGARVWHESAPRGVSTSLHGKRPSAPRGGRPESAAPRGAPPEEARGAPLSGSTDPAEEADRVERPAGRSVLVQEGAPRGVSTSLHGKRPSAPRGVKRRPARHGRPGKEVDSPPPPAAASRGGGPASRRGPAAAPRVPAHGKAAAGFSTGLGPPATPAEALWRAFAGVAAHQAIYREVGHAGFQRLFKARNCGAGPRDGHCDCGGWRERIGPTGQGGGAR